MRPSTILWLAGYGLSLSLASPLLAQESAPEITVFEAFPGGLPPGMALPPGAQGPSAAPAAPDDPKTAPFLKLKFDRSAPAILQAVAALSRAGEPAREPAETFRLNIVAGRWKDAAPILKTLPEKDAGRVYEYLLKDLDRSPTPVVTPGQPPPQGVPPPAPTLLLEDIAELADLAPAPVSEAQLKLLGALLTRVLAANAYLDPLLARLEKGTAQLGGADASKREKAAQLLLNANRDLDAAKFLPPLAPDVAKRALPLVEKHVRCALSQFRADAKKEGLDRAWELNGTILARADAPPDVRERAWTRAAEMIPLLPTAQGAQWLQETFVQRAEQGLTMLTAVAGQFAKDRASRELPQRKKNLELQRQVVAALLPALEKNAEWRRALDLFALNWVEEADYARKRYVSPRRQNMQVDEFGNQVFYGDGSYQNPNDPNQLPPLPIADVFPSAPDEAWLGALDPGLRPRALALLAELHVKLENDAKALPYLEKLAPLQPTEALRLSNDLLRAWAAARDPQRAAPRNRSSRVYYGPGAPQMQGTGIPLTRALQQRSLEELSALLQRLRALPIPPLEDTAIVAAFGMAHSPAEVFREESIALVLGKVEDANPATLGELLQTMRQRLATQWRKPSVQQQAKTQRTDAQIDAEVMRGYELLAELIERALTKHPDDWRFNLVQAAAWFDWAEFQYGKKVDLAVYVEKRERAFDGFARAAELYAARVPSLELKDETPLIYQQWLNANLGASDLAFVTRQQEASANHLERVRKAILALPGGAAERHFAALGKAILASGDSIPANLKPAYMGAALRILGERDDAAEIRKLVAYYDGLTREIEASVRIDGDTAVGHTEPFGVFFTVRHTAELERENSGGFSKYLRNQSQNPNYYNPYGIAPIDHRDELEKQMRAKLSEGFEILSLTFHDEKVQSRGAGRAGWRETPLVYLLLKAKDASVDRIPSLRLDADFVDRFGPVVLPVESAVQLIDARPTRAPARPIAELEVTQVLDDRAVASGKLALEIKASAKGVVPAFTELFDFAPAGFKIDETEDSGPAIQRFDSAGEELAGAAERNWVIKLSADPNATGAPQFKFPKPKRDDLKVSYKRYQDADLVEVAPELALAGLPLRPTRWWPWALLAVAVLGAAVWFFVKRPGRGAEVSARPAYAVPASVTPFTALALLREMHADSRVPFSGEERGRLAQTIAALEAQFFARSSNGGSVPDLESIAREWVGQTLAPASLRAERRWAAAGGAESSNL